MRYLKSTATREGGGGRRAVEGEAHYGVLKTLTVFKKANIDPHPELLESGLHFLNLFLYITFDVILRYDPRASTRYYFVTCPDRSIIFFDLIASTVLV
jgi:hypothetical protein